jgi:hypothetical protein
MVHRTAHPLRRVREMLSSKATACRRSASLCKPGGPSATPATAPVVVIDQTHPSTLAEIWTPEFLFLPRTGLNEQIWGKVAPILE